MTAWQSLAACHPDNGHDPDLWFGGPDTDDIGHGNSNAVKAAKAKAQRICRGCLVRADCLSAGAGEASGIWGGIDERTRRQSRRVQPIQRDICGAERGYARHLEAGEHPCMACRRFRAQQTRERRVAG